LRRSSSNTDRSTTRFAISIARTHSLVPRIHGVNIESYSQLYPLLIAPFFRHGLVPQNVHTVHLVNAGSFPLRAYPPSSWRGESPDGAGLRTSPRH
jgi:hypothetical protein